MGWGKNVGREGGKIHLGGVKLLSDPMLPVETCIAYNKVYQSWVPVLNNSCLFVFNNIETETILRRASLIQHEKWNVQIVVC